MKTNTNHPHSGAQSERLRSLIHFRVARWLRLVTLLLALTGITTITAQSAERIVKGRVTQAEDSEQLAGVHIQLKGTTLGTTTDAGGQFTFPQKLKAQDILVFSFVGLKTQEYTVTETTPEFLDIQMTYEDITMVGELSDDDVFTARKHVLTRVFSALRRNK